MDDVGSISPEQASLELKKRFEENKILFYRPCCKVHDPAGERTPCPEALCPSSKHVRFHISEKRIRIVFGGNRCISGDTMILNPMTGKTTKVREIDSDFYVWAWDGEKLIPSIARKPFVKGFDDLYEVSLANGGRIICTKNHRILTKDGFSPVSDLSSATFVLAPEPPAVSMASPFSAVISINKIGRGSYYDFEVPGPNNYFAGGMIHHNSGKSILGLSEMLMMATMKRHPLRKTTNPTRGRYRIYNSDYGIIEKLTLPLVREWIPKAVLSGEGQTKAEAWSNSYDNKYHILKLKNDVTIDFMSYDQDADKSESVELDGVWADEEMPENIFSAVLSRLISRDGRIWMTVTPLYGISWAMRFFDGTDNNVETLTLDIMDNPYLSEKVVREFESSLPEHEKEARLHGKFLDLQGVVYKELRSDIHLVDVKGPAAGDPVIMTLDPHPRKPSVITWAYVNNREEVIFFDELEISGTAKEIVRAIRYKESDHGAQVLLRLIDPAAKAQGSNIAFETDTLKEFEREGMSFTLADNSEAGYGIVHEYLRFDDQREMGFFNKPQCYFTRAVPKTWYAMTHLMWQDWTNPNMRARRDKQERIVDKGKDFPDTVRYTLAIRPTYRTFANAKPVLIGNAHGMERYQSRPVRDYFFGRS